MNGKRKAAARGRSKVNVISRFREFGNDIVIALKYPFLLALLSLEGLTTLIAVFIIMAASVSYGLIGGYMAGIGVWCTLNSPIIYKTWRKINEEDDVLYRKVMSEGWEGKKSTSELVDEYEELIEKK